MKKLITVLCLVLAFVSLCVLSACKLPDSPPDDGFDNPFINPGDSLGGGGVGDVANNVDTSKTEDNIDKVITDIDTDNASSSQTPDDAVTPDSDDDNVVTITKDGAYTLSGNYSKVVIDGSGLNVQLILNNATINNSNGVAIDGTSKGKKLTVTLTATEGTTNTVTNNGDGVNAVHVKGSLTVNGKGNLTVNSASKSALKASKGIVIADASLTLSAVNHAITGSNVTVANCSINVTSAGKDGINAECDDAEQYVTDDGYVYLKNVNYTCNVSGDGVQADTWLYVDGGVYDVTTVGTFVQNTSANMQLYGMTSDDFRYAKSGNTYQKLASDETNRYSTRYGLIQSAKGFKVGEIEYTDSDGKEVTVTDGDYCIKLVSGTFTLDCTDDAIHTNCGDVIISGGTYTITTLDDGITADGTTKITNGNINIVKSYEGIEGAYVEISGGTINLVSTDDGINAASDDTSIVEHLIISGGNVTVNASGDGLDSNGSILISGGNVIVHGPTNGGDAGMDADRGIVVNGGTLFASSSLGMVETPSTNSTQYVLSYAQQSQVSVGTVLTITDANNNVLYTVTTTKACQSIIISIPNFEKGQTYSICGNGTTLATFTVSSAITTVGSSGGMGGPGGGWGGRPGR